LVLQLVHQDGPEYGTFLHAPGKKFTDFTEIREEIAAETERACPGKGISANPISLKVYSPDVVQLTLVDLPGMTRVPVGNQPADIEKQIRDMILKFISRENAIILAVTAANSDLANSDALQLARHVDPKGRRTLGVLTKVDIMDKGTDCVDVMEGRVVPLALGYVPVVMRSQEDINQGKTVRKQLQDEEAFFERSPAYRRFADQTGVRYLSQTMHQLLLSHIHAFLPTLRHRVNTMLDDAERERTALGSPVTDDEASRNVLILDAISGVADRFRDALFGDGDDVEVKRRRADPSSAAELTTGARLAYVFVDVYGAHLASLSPLTGLTESAIKTALHNAAGTAPSLFIAEPAFDALARRQVGALREPALQCVDLAHEELRRVVARQVLPSARDLDRFRAFRVAISEELMGQLATCAEQAKTMVNALIDVELAHIDTSHPDFQGADDILERMLMESMRENERAAAEEGGEGAPAQGGSSSSKGSGSRSSSAKPEPKQPKLKSASKFSMGRRKEEALPKLRKVPNTIRAGSYKTDKEKFEIEVMTTLIVSYFDIVRKKMMDLVPKTIMHFLVRESQRTCQQRLVSVLYRRERIDKYLAEDPALSARRKEFDQLVVTLRQAQVALATFGTGGAGGMGGGGGGGYGRHHHDSGMSDFHSVY
jgi:replication fork clamp-binding protein CrfC